MAAPPALRADQDLHPALLKRYAGRRITYAALYGCGVPQSAAVARQGTAGALRRRCKTMKLNLSLLLLIILAFAASLLAGRVWLPPSSLLSPHDSWRA